MLPRFTVASTIFPGLFFSYSHNFSMGAWLLLFGAALFTVTASCFFSVIIVGIRIQLKHLVGYFFCLAHFPIPKQKLGLLSRIFDDNKKLHKSIYV